MHPQSRGVPHRVGAKHLWNVPVGIALNQPLDACDLPKRAINALTRAGLETLEETNEWSDRALLSLPHFGSVFLTALRSLAAENSPESHCLGTMS